MAARPLEVLPLGAAPVQWPVHWCAPCRENDRVARRFAAASRGRFRVTRLRRVDASLELVRRT
jgi:hypothetical protein